jgi:hypothetical protein
MTLAFLAAASATYVIENPRPAEAAQAVWYDTTSAKVFAALLPAVHSVPILGSAVIKLSRKESNAFHAWQLITEHFIREADFNLPFLQAQLRALKPQHTESMESFLSRSQSMRDLYAAHSLDLSDRDLIIQVFSSLSMSCRQSVRQHFPGQAIESRSWEEIARILQREDNERAQCDTTAPDASLPLGWKAGQGGIDLLERLGEAKLAQAARVEGGKVDTPWRPFSPPRRTSSPYRRGSPPKKGSSPPKGEHGSQARGRSESGPLVCYCCFKVGHGLRECRHKPNDFVLTTEARQKAKEVKEAWVRTQAQKGGQQSSQASPRGSPFQSPTKGSASRLSSPGRKVTRGVSFKDVLVTQVSPPMSPRDGHNA